MLPLKNRGSLGEHDLGVFCVFVKKLQEAVETVHSNFGIALIPQLKPGVNDLHLAPLFISLHF